MHSKMMATTYGPPLPPPSHGTPRSLVKQNAYLYAAAHVLLHFIETEERAEDSYLRGMIRAHFRASYMDRRASFLDVEFAIIYRMSRRSLEQLRHEMYPYLRVHLSDAQIEGRANGNRRPLTVDEKLGIGVMTAGGCTLGGILQSFHVGRTCALLTITKFFEAVVLSKVGEIKFPSTLFELQAAADAWFATRAFCPLFYGHVGALDGLAVRILMPK